MSELRIEAEPRAEGGVRLRLEGILDGGGAYVLRDRLVMIGRAPIVVDFSRLNSLSDFGLGILAMALAEMSFEVQLVGLGHHPQRILQAFGISLAA